MHCERPSENDNNLVNLIKANNITSSLNSQVNIYDQAGIPSTNFLMLYFLAPSTKPIAWLQLEMFTVGLDLDHAVAVRVAPVLLPAGLPVTNQR